MKRQSFWCKQTPFSTIGIGSETTREGRSIQKWVFRNRGAGFGKGKKRTAIFPKISFACSEGHSLNKGDVNYDIFQEAQICMSKAIYPDIVFVTKEQIEKETIVYPMGKQLPNDIERKKKRCAQQ